jgi:6-pyruvoyltetrahydropterin/6-carboxytetrahydropterin synthase
MPRIEMVKEFRFEAAHRLTAVREGHKCARMHGHSFRIEIKLEGEVDPQKGWLIDFGDISSVVKPILRDHLDHKCLNDISGLENPTSEHLCIWLWNHIKPSLPFLVEVTVHETCTARSSYRGQ